MTKRRLLFVLLLCALCMASFAESAVQPTYTLAKDDSVHSICADEKGGFYLLTERELRYFTAAEGDAGTLLTEAVADLAGMVCEQNQLYAVTGKHEVLRLNEGAWETIGQTDQFDESPRLVQMTAGDGHLYYSFKEEENHDAFHVVDFDLSAVAYAEIKDFSYWWIGYDRKQHMLISLGSVNERPDDEDVPNTVLMNRYQPSSGQVLEPVAMRGISNVFWQTCHPSDGSLFFSTVDKHVWRWSADAGAETVASAPRSGKMAALADGRVVMMSMDGNERWFVYLVGEGKPDD